MTGAARVLMVVTSSDRIDDAHPTGVWFEEFAVPYTRFRQAGMAVTVASPRGGAAPVDPRSLEDDRATPDNEAARAALAATRPLGPDLRAEDFDAVFFAGGHGTLFDLPEDPQVQRLVTEFLQAGKVVAALCHGPAGLLGARRGDGTPLVRGRHVTAFTNAEEQAVQLDTRVPFLLESRLRALGAVFEPAPEWQDHVVSDGNLITGQNPQSTASVAKAVIERLKRPAGAGRAG